MQRRGFTIVELVITIAIMGILLILAVVSLNATQINARDTERKTDVESIALHLESYYKNVPNLTVGVRYPSTAITATGMTTINSALPDIDIKSVLPPSTTNPVATFRGATSSSTSAPITASPNSPTTGEYVYQPLQANGAVCTTELQECRKFNLYYRTETDNVVHTITSKHQ